jgi:hypothetical protein
MSNQWYQPADLDDEDDEGQGPPNTGQQQLPKGFRTALAKAQKEARDLKEANEKLLAQVRQTAISQVLTTKGVSNKLAKLVPADIEPTAEAVEKWLEEYSDVFPVKAASDGNSADGSDGDDSGGDEAAQMALIAQAANGAQAPGRQADLLKQLQSKDLKRDDLIALIEAAGGGSGAG